MLVGTRDGSALSQHRVDMIKGIANQARWRLKAPNLQPPSAKKPG